MAKHNRRRSFSARNKNSAPRGLEELETRLLFAIIHSISFGNGVSYAAGGSPIAMVAGDFGLSGHDGVAVANSAGNSVSIFASDWEGGLFLRATIPTGNGPVDIATADLDRDGLLDLVVPCSSGQITIIPNLRILSIDLAGTSFINLNFTPGACAVADFDRDAIPDILVSNVQGGNVFFLRGRGDGTFENGVPSLATTGINHMIAGDFDRDGILDVVTSSETAGVRILVGNGTGGFTLAGSVGVTGAPKNIVVADIERDGKLDLMIATSANKIYEFLGVGDGTFIAAPVYTQIGTPGAMVMARFNNDGAPDLALAIPDGNTIKLLAGGALGARGALSSPGQRDTLTESLGASALVAIDLNDDGSLDLISADQAGNSVTAYLNTSALNVLGFQLSQQPTGGAAGTPIAPITLTAKDGTQQVVDTFNQDVTVSIEHGPAGGAILGTTTLRTVSGVVTFDDLAFTKAGRYQLQFRSGSLLTTTESFVITAGAAAGLTFVQNPTAVVAGQPMLPGVTVQVVDAFGNFSTTDTSSITLSIDTGPLGAAPLGGLLTMAAVNGVAMFVVSEETAGKFTLKASSGALAIAKSKSFVVSPDENSGHLVVIRNPSTATVGAMFAPTLQVAVEDQFGNIIKSDHSKMTVAIDAGPIEGVLAGTLTATAAGGVATFAKLRIGTVGDYTLSITDDAIANTTPVTFDITIAPGSTAITTPKLAAGGYTFGKPFSFSAKLTSSSPLPVEGFVVAIDTQTGDPLAYAQVGPGGALKFEPGDLEPGNYTVRLEYEGDDNHAAGTSAPFLLKYNQVATTLTLRAAPPVYFGEDLLLTATLKAGSGAGLSLAGDMIFMDGGNVIETAPVFSLGSVQIYFAVPATGPHSLTAIYTGDGHFKTSTSLTINSTVKKNRLSGVLTQSVVNSVPLNSDVDLTLQIAVISSGTSTPVSGNVTFKDGATVLGVGALDQFGQAVLENVQFTIAGKHSIRAYYEGDVNTNAFTSAVLTIVAA